MNKMLAGRAQGLLSLNAWKTALALAVIAALTGGFWMAWTPMAQADPKLTPVEMIQSKLPRGKTIASGTDTEVLDAVCKAVKQNPNDTALIVRTVASARKSLRTDLVCMAARCTRDDKGMGDCSWVRGLVDEWVKEDPTAANHIYEAIANCAPDCKDILQGEEGGGAFGNPMSNINPPPGSIGGGTTDTTCTVCHNGQNIQVACSDLANYLAGHPGDKAGACEATAVVNK